MTYREWRRWGADVLEKGGILDFENDSYELLLEVLGLSKAEYLTRLDALATEKEGQDYARMIRARADHLPVQLITGQAWFMGLPFAVSGDVLVPRQDTEVLADAALSRISQWQSRGPVRVLDLCTGSGCIAVSIACLADREVQVAASDLSEAALAVARSNAATNHCAIDFRRGNLFEPFSEDEVFDVIVSNPPYIPTGEIAGLMPEVRDHEPRMALDGGADGLAFYRRLASETCAHLAEGGYFFFECGAGQSGDILRLLTEVGSYDALRVIDDLAGHDRVVTGRRKMPL